MPTPSPDGPPLGPTPDLASVPEPIPRREAACTACARPYLVAGRRYQPLSTADDYQQRGIATWYGRKFHGRPTATGEAFDMYALSAAHRTLPLPCFVEVTNLGNGMSVVVRVNDRGPFVKNRIIDLSYAAATRIGMVKDGTAMVEVRWLDPGAEIGAANESEAPSLYLQVGAFADANNAERLSRRLVAAGFGAVAVTAAVTQGGQADRTMHRVRMGPLTVKAADNTVGRLLRMGLSEPQVVIE